MPTGSVRSSTSSATRQTSMSDSAVSMVLQLAALAARGRPPRLLAALRNQAEPPSRLGFQREAAVRL